MIINFDLLTMERLTTREAEIFEIILLKVIKWSSADIFHIRFSFSN